MSSVDGCHISSTTLKGCKNAIVHLYNSTSLAQREQVFRKSKEEIIKIAVTGAKLCKEYREKYEGNFRFEYSPESFTGTEPEFALEISNVVLDIWQPSTDDKVILNLPVIISTLPVRSPFPNNVPSTRSAPAKSPISVSATAQPLSLCGWSDISHQDAIAKGMKWREEGHTEYWTVPYLPIDPEDVGREYSADVIRINSQSGKGGIGYILETRFGYDLPKKMREKVGVNISIISHCDGKINKERKFCLLFIISTEKCVYI